MIGLAIGCAGLLPGAADWRGLARQIWNVRGGLLLCLVLANAPDIDFLFGISKGNLNFYHQTGTHTVAWIALVSLSVWMIIWLAIPRGAGQARLPRTRHDHEGSPTAAESARGFFFILALTGSHLIADMGCADNSPPYGLMLTWPFSDRYWTLPVALFPAVAKSAWADLWTLHNVGVMTVEMLITLPLVAAVLLWKRRAVSRFEK